MIDFELVGRSADNAAPAVAFKDRFSQRFGFVALDERLAESVAEWVRVGFLEILAQPFGGAGRFELRRSAWFVPHVRHDGEQQQDDGDVEPETEVWDGGWLRRTNSATAVPLSRLQWAVWLARFNHRQDAGTDRLGQLCPAVDDGEQIVIDFADRSAQICYHPGGICLFLGVFVG